MVVEDECDDVHGAAPGRFDEALGASLAFKTAYEERWIRGGAGSTSGWTGPLRWTPPTSLASGYSGAPGAGRPAFRPRRRSSEGEEFGAEAPGG